MSTIDRETQQEIEAAVAAVRLRVDELARGQPAAVAAECDRIVADQPVPEKLIEAVRQVQP
jgi:hypothetical protein